jgi:hypothetical protein
MLDPDALTHSHCCDMMTFQVRRHGQCGPGCLGPHDCPDSIVYHASDGSYGLLIHDGGASFVQIAYCPWCAAPLPGGEWVRSLPDGRLPADALEEGAGPGADPGRRIDLG